MICFALFQSPADNVFSLFMPCCCARNEYEPFLKCCLSSFQTFHVCVKSSRSLKGTDNTSCVFFVFLIVFLLFFIGGQGVHPSWPSCLPFLDMVSRVVDMVSIDKLSTLGIWPVLRSTLLTPFLPISMTPNSSRRLITRDTLRTLIPSSSAACWLVL